MRILMIEDNESNAYLARFLLEQRGHEVVVAPTGTEGVALARASRYDLILLDLRLPDGDGCSAFIEKPIDVTTFADRIEEIAGSHH